MIRGLFNLGLLPLTAEDYPDGEVDRLYKTFGAVAPIFWWRGVVIARRLAQLTQGDRLRPGLPSEVDFGKGVLIAQAEYKKAEGLVQCPSCQAELGRPRVAWVHLHGDVTLPPALVDHVLVGEGCEECGEHAGDPHRPDCQTGFIHAGCLARLADESAWTMMYLRRCVGCSARIYDALDAVRLPDGRTIARDTRFVQKGGDHADHAPLRDGGSGGDP